MDTPTGYRIGIDAAALEAEFNAYYERGGQATADDVWAQITAAPRAGYTPGPFTFVRSPEEIADDDALLAEDVRNERYDNRPEDRG